MNFRAQRQLDDDEIPPADLSTDQSLTNDETKNSSTESENNLIDERPLTELETPFEDRQENEETKNSSTESENNLIDDRPLTELETPYENHQENEDSLVQSPEEEEVSTNQNESYSLTESETVVNPITLATFLPDIIAETIEKQEDDSVPQTTQLEDFLLNENPEDFTEQDFPPLPLPANPIQPKLDDEEYPPLPSVTAKPDQILSEEPTLPQPEDVLGNKTLFKQVNKRCFFFLIKKNAIELN